MKSSSPFLPVNIMRTIKFKILQTRLTLRRSKLLRKVKLYKMIDHDHKELSSPRILITRFKRRSPNRRLDPGCNDRKLQLHPSAGRKYLTITSLLNGLIYKAGID